MKRLGLASVAIFSLLWGTSASAEELRGFRLLNLSGVSVHWAGIGTEPVSIAYAFVTQPLRFPGALNCESVVPLDDLMERSNISPSALQIEVRAAFDLWEKAANIRFVETSNPERARIMIGAQQAPEGRAFTNVAQRHGSPGEIERSVICLNPDKPWKVGFDGDLNVYDLRYTFAHEIGHAIGLDHPPCRMR